MAMKPNYNFEKRQRELAKKKQQDEKRLKKQRAKDEGTPPQANPAAPSAPHGNDAGP
jgi:hypothetical protein